MTVNLVRAVRIPAVPAGGGALYTRRMAMKTITILTDDLDGEELPAGTRSTRFALDGVEYEIDLGADNARALADALAPYIAAARRVGTATRSASPRRARGADAERLAAIRAWAQQQGHPVGDRGRIRAEVVEAYDAAH